MNYSNDIWSIEYIYSMQLIFACIVAYFYVQYVFLPFIPRWIWMTVWWLQKMQVGLKLFLIHSERNALNGEIVIRIHFNTVYRSVMICNENRRKITYQCKWLVFRTFWRKSRTNPHAQFVHSRKTPIDWVHVDPPIVTVTNSVMFIVALWRLMLKYYKRNTSVFPCRKIIYWLFWIEGDDPCMLMINS